MIDGALQAVAEGAPAVVALPGAGRLQQLFLWFFAVVIIAIAVPLVAWWQRRRGNSTPAHVRRCCRPDSSVSASCRRPCNDPTRRTSRGWRSSRGRCSPWRSPRSRSRHWPASVRVAQVAGIVAVGALMFVVAPFYTYRHYLLHTRVSLGDVPLPFDGRA